MPDSLRNRIKQLKSQAQPEDNTRYPGERIDSQNMEPPYNPYQKNEKGRVKDGPLGDFQDNVNPLELVDYADDEQEELKQKIKRYKRRKDNQTRNTYNYEEGFKPEYIYNNIPGIYSETNRFKHLLSADADAVDSVPSYDGISPLLNTPDYCSDWSYSYHINNNVPFSKRKRFKKKRKDGITSQDNQQTKVAFTAPSGIYPTFSDIKTPFNQILSVLTSNFNAIEKFIKDQEKGSKKVADAIDKLEKDVSDLKKKTK